MTQWTQLGSVAGIIISALPCQLLLFRQPERSESSSDECDCNDWLPKNPNRIQFDHVDDTGSSSSEEEINDCREVPKKPVTEEDALEDSCRCIQLSD